MARDFLHDERVAVLEDVDADELQLQREFFRDELRQAARQQVDAVGAADFLHGREDRVDGEMVDRVRDLEHGLVEDFVDADIVTLFLAFFRDEIAQLGKARDAAFLDRARHRPPATRMSARRRR